MEVQQREDGSPRWWPELGWLDWTSFGLLSALMLALCVVRSRSRFFWSDELFSFTLLRDPVLKHTVHGWWAGADSGGLLYYLIGYVWFRVFGASALVLRLLSTTSFIVALGIIWTMARRFYAAPVVAIVTALSFLLPAYIVWQEGNGRFYGIFLATAAFAAACTMAAAERPRCSRQLLLLTCCAHACLIGSHVLGLVYSAGLLLALIVSDLFVGRRRPLLYGSVLLAWIVVVCLSLHSIRATAAIAQGVFWPTRPHLRELVLGFFSYSRKLVAFAQLLELAIIARYLFGAPDASEMQRRFRSHRSVAVVVGGLLAGQLAIFLKSRTGLSVYSDRYLLPVTIALILLLAEGLTQALGLSLLRRITRPIPALALSLAAIITAFFLATRADAYAPLYASLDYPAKFKSLLPPERNVVVTYTPIFMVFNIFDPAHHYTFATDWQYDGATPGSDLSGQRLMENVQRGFATHQVLDLPEIVRELPEFTLVAEPARLPWLTDRFIRGGQFEVTQVGSLADWYPMTIWRIRCLHPALGCRPGFSTAK